MWPWTRTQNRDTLTLEQVIGWDTGPRYPGDFAGRTRSGVPVTADQSLRLSAVWACRRLLADTISSLPVDAYRQGSRTPIDPTPSILAMPGSDTPLDEWLDQGVMFATGGGNTFGLVTARSGAGLRPSQIDLIDPSRVVSTVAADRTIEWRLDGRAIDPSELWQEIPSRREGARAVPHRLRRRVGRARARRPGLRREVLRRRRHPHRNPHVRPVDPGR